MGQLTEERQALCKTSTSPITIKIITEYKNHTKKRIYTTTKKNTTNNKLDELQQKLLHETPRYRI